MALRRALNRPRKATSVQKNTFSHDRQHSGAVHDALCREDSFIGAFACETRTALTVSVCGGSEGSSEVVGNPEANGSFASYWAPRMDVRRLVVRYERYAQNFLGMLHLGCCLILLRHL